MNIQIFVFCPTSFFSNYIQLIDQFEKKSVRQNMNIYGYTHPSQLAFLTLCDQAFNLPFLSGKVIELAKFCFMNKQFDTNLLFFSEPVIVSHCV